MTISQQKSSTVTMSNTQQCKKNNLKNLDASLRVLSSSHDLKFRSFIRSTGSINKILPKMVSLESFHKSWQWHWDSLGHLNWTRFHYRRKLFPIFLLVGNFLLHSFMYSFFCTTVREEMLSCVLEQDWVNYASLLKSSLSEWNFQGTVKFSRT